MLQAKVGFVVYGVHKDGLRDPSGDLFIDEGVIRQSKDALKARGLVLKENDLIVATKEEAKKVLLDMRNDDSIDCLVLFSGTWVWAAHMIASIREFAKTGKGILIWTHDGSQGWRPVGGLVLSAALKEVGIRHQFVYGGADSEKDVTRIVDFCMASALKHKLEMTTLAAFGGRGMGQTCGAADPSQWMKMFGIDIDSRDTTELVQCAKAIGQDKVDAMYETIGKKFIEAPEKNAVHDRSIRLYIALKELMAKYGFDYYTIQSFPGLADDYTATCFAQSMMLEDGVPTSTLSDFNTAMTSIALTYLSSERVYYGDMQHVDKERKEVKIIGDGAISPSLANSGGATFARHGIPTEGSAGGLSVSLVCKKGKGVLARLGREDGKFRMVIAACEVVEPDKSELEKRMRECGIPFWPHAFVKVDADMDKLVENWNNEYACLGYGEALYRQLAYFCELTGIEAVLL